MTTTNTIILILLLLFLFLLHCMIQDTSSFYSIYIIQYTDFIKLYILFLSFFVELLLLLLLLSISFSFFQIWVEDYSTFLSTHVYPKSIILGFFLGFAVYFLESCYTHTPIVYHYVLFFNTPSLLSFFISVYFASTILLS